MIWDDAGYRQFIEGQVVPAVRNAAVLTQFRARAVLARKNRLGSGALYNSIQVERLPDTMTRVKFAVGSPLKYAIYQEMGVPGPVLPKRAKVLRFQPKGSSTFVFARSTKGFKEARFLRDALDMVSPGDFHI